MEKKEIIKMMEKKGFEFIKDDRLFPKKDTICYYYKTNGNTAYSLRFKLKDSESN